MTGSGAARSTSSRSWRSGETRLAWALVLPAVATIALVVVFPIGWTFWESLHLHDLRMPWLGRPRIGLANYAEALNDGRLWGAMAHTGVFVTTSVALELIVGLVLALALDRLSRGGSAVRAAVLLPWAIPTVVVALVWRFIFESPAGLAHAIVTQLGMTPPTWFADAVMAWLPIVLADVWKTTPFVALLLLAGLQGIDRTLYEAAAMDGASPWRRFTGVTLPLLRPALLVASLFRALDAFRVFDVIYVMTGGGPGTATEPIAVYTFVTLMQNLRFGYGSALSVMMFVVAFVCALVVIHGFGGDALVERRR
jgi:ABC-type sugar transport system permease subunit